MKKTKKIFSLVLTFLIAFSGFGISASAELSLFDPSVSPANPSISYNSTDITVLAPDTSRQPYSSGEVRLSNNAIIVTDVVWGEAAPGDTSFRWMEPGESFKDGYDYRVAILYGMNPASLSSTYDHTITVNGETPTNRIDDNAVYGTVYQDFDNLLGNGGGFFEVLVTILSFPFILLSSPFIFLFSLLGF